MALRFLFLVLLLGVGYAEEDGEIVKDGVVIGRSAIISGSTDISTDIPADCSASVASEDTKTERSSFIGAGVCGGTICHGICDRQEGCRCVPRPETQDLEECKARARRHDAMDKAHRIFEDAGACIYPISKNWIQLNDGQAYVDCRKKEAERKAIAEQEEYYKWEEIVDSDIPHACRAISGYRGIFYTSSGYECRYTDPTTEAYSFHPWGASKCSWHRNIYPDEKLEELRLARGKACQKYYQ
jgi:hypothetical protein